MRVPMLNHTDTRRRVARGPIVYDAAPGEVVEAYPMDVGRLSTRGFVRLDAFESEDPTPPTLDDLTMDELRARLPEDVEVPAKIRKHELVELVRAQAQEV